MLPMMSDFADAECATIRVRVQAGLQRGRNQGKPRRGGLLIAEQGEERLPVLWAAETGIRRLARVVSVGFRVEQKVVDQVGLLATPVMAT